MRQIEEANATLIVCNACGDVDERSWNSLTLFRPQLVKFNNCAHLFLWSMCSDVRYEEQPSPPDPRARLMNAFFSIVWRKTSAARRSHFCNLIIACLTEILRSGVKKLNFDKNISTTTLIIVLYSPRAQN